MPDQDGPYSLSCVLREELEALRGIQGDRPLALDALAAAFPMHAAFPEDAAGRRDELERCKAVYRAAHRLDPGLRALCLSGGGIRSASFSLGVIQGLAEAKLLKTFDYLSTVSGGGYIGSWLSAWLHRTDPDTVVQALQPARQQPDNEPEPIRHLREYSSFLTPQVGLLSADTWAAAAIVLRNISLNWLILIPAIALPVIGLKLVAALAHTGKDASTVWVYVVALLCWFFGSIALGYKWLRLYSGADLRPDEAQRNFLLLSVFPAVLAGAGFGWLTIWGGTPGDGLLKWLPSPIGDQPPAHFVEWIRTQVFAQLACLGKATSVASWLRMILFALLVYLGAAAAAYIGSWFSRPAADEARRRQLGWDAAAWLLAVGVFATAIWLSVQFYIGMNTDTNGTISLYDAICVIQSTPCAAGAKPRMALLSIHANKEVLLVIFGMPSFLLATLLAHTTYLALRSNSPTGDIAREWLGRASGWHFIAALLWIVLSTVVLLGPKLYFSAAMLGENAGNWLAAISAASGTITALLAKSGVTPARGAASGWTGISANVILAIAGAIFAVSLLILLSAWADGIVLYYTGGGTGCFSNGGTPIPPGCYKWWGWSGLGLAIVAVMVVASFFVNVNRFSLHAVYRNRLIRAYLGASRPDRKPDGFTGFDWNDNLRVARLWDDTVNPAQHWRPFHVINMTLNLAATSNLAWQQRKGSSFIVTPKFSGAAELGYRPTRDYGNPIIDDQPKPSVRGITLGTAMAISGAAVSPNMGYHSSPAAAFLLTLFDVRLGWWLGNPGLAGDRMGKFERMLKQVLSLRSGRLAPYKQEGPFLALVPLLSELFGLTNEDSAYVYLSDGGHFEDLGLYEMVRRRCRWIVVCDGAEDRGRAYEDLGNAVRKIWIDLGIRISFEGSFLLQADKDTKAEEMPYFAVGTVNYVSDGEAAVKGKILYIKPAVRGDESAADVIAYQRLNPDFPQQSTGDQWFDEPQIEAYRALGYLIVRRIVRAVKDHTGDAPADLAALFEGLRGIDPKTLGPRTLPYDEA